MVYVIRDIPIIRQINVIAVDDLKRKIINEYEEYICKLSRGHRGDYSYLLNEIDFVDIHSKLDRCPAIKEYLLNN